MKHLLLFTLFLIIFSNCTRKIPLSGNESNDLTEGAIYYDISGDRTTSRWDLKVYFDPNNARVQEKYAFTTSKTYIYNKESNEILGLINDLALNYKFKRSYLTYYTPEQLISTELSSNYGNQTVKETNEYKSILGYKCRKTIIYHGKQAEAEIWTTDKIKPGIILPWTPLANENLALEYEFRVLGSVYHKYTAIYISNKIQDKNIFEHKVPDEYKLVVPLTVFSSDPLWANKYEENEFSSFTYPFFGSGRDETKQYLKKEITNILKEGSLSNISLFFTVLENGKLTAIDVDYNYSNDYAYLKQIKTFLKKMPAWTPAKVLGRPVKSQVSIEF